MKKQRLELRKGAAPLLRSVMFVSTTFVAFFALAAAAFAISMDGTSRSYLLSRETADQTSLMPGFEYLDFSLKDIGDESISAHFGGWGSFDFKEETGDTDLQYGFVSFKRGTSNSTVNLGRIMVFEGVAAERVDGAYARTDLRGGFGASAFGGVPVLTSLQDQPGNKSIYGARISHRVDGLYTIGFSYLKSELNSSVFREEEGLDLWLQPVNKVELLGRSTYNAETTGWMEHSYNLLLGPFSDLRLNTEVSQVDYQNLFFGLTSKAFVFQPGGPIDPLEKLGVLGETASYAVSDRMNASVEYKQYSYDIAGSANRTGLGITYSIPQSYSAGASLHRMDGETDRLSYKQYRVYAFKKMGKADAAVDLFGVKYDEAINGVADAWSASLALGYELTQALKISVDAEYSKNPDFDKDVRVFGKLIYSFAVARERASRGEAPRAIPAPPVEQQPVVTPATPPPPVVEQQPSAPAVEPQAAPPAQPAEQQTAPAAPAEQQTAPAGSPEQSQRKEGTQ